jgi:hypothetical protein
VRRPEVDRTQSIPAWGDIITSSAFPVERSLPQGQPPQATGYPNRSTTQGPMH